MCYTREWRVNTNLAGNWTPAYETSKCRTNTIDCFRNNAGEKRGLYLRDNTYVRYISGPGDDKNARRMQMFVTPVRRGQEARHQEWESDFKYCQWLRRRRRGSHQKMVDEDHGPLCTINLGSTINEFEYVPPSRVPKNFPNGFSNVLNEYFLSIFL